MISGRRCKAQHQAQGQRRLVTQKATEVRRRRWWWISGIVLVVVVGLRFGLGLGLGGSSSHKSHLKLASLATLSHLVSPPQSGSLGPEGVLTPPVARLATTSTDATGQIVNGISCDTNEQVVFHVHTHLTIFVDGTARQIPDGIGIVPPRTVQQTPQGPFVRSGGCFYWLHTHAKDGIIHIESPVQGNNYTLGDFFAIWGQPLGSNQVGPSNGKVTAFFNGKVYLGNLRNIPLGNHVQIQLDVGRPLVGPESIDFPSGL